MNYLDFVVQLGTAPGGGYTVRVDSPKGAAEEGFTPPDLSREIRETAIRLEKARDLTPAWTQVDEEPLCAAGDRLFRSLFPKRIRDRFFENLGALPEGRDWRLRLKIRTNLSDPSLVPLHRLPWEYLFREDTGHFLSLGGRTSIVRHLDLPLGHERPPLLPPVRILLVISQPQGLPSLTETTRELRAIEALQGPYVEVSPPVATMGGLRRLLKSRDFHILHFMGHGGFDSRTGKGILYFEDESGSAAPVRSATLANRLRGHTSLRLVFLNACRTAETAAASPFAGMASALLQAGIPAVVAMQFPITDQAAADFSEVFYESLTAGEPVDEAVAEGRLAIEGRSDGSIEWATPALFLQSREGRIVLPPPDPIQENPESPPQEKRETMKDRRLWAAISVALILSAGLLYQPWKRGGETPTYPTETDRSAKALSTLIPTSAAPVQECPKASSTEEALPPDTYQLADTAPCRIPEIRRQLTAQFYWSYGIRKVRLYLENIKEPQKFISPGTVEFTTKRGICSLYVSTIDYKLKILTVRPISGDC